MINNDILRRVSTIFELSEQDICTVFSLGQCEVTTEQLAQLFKEKNDEAYIALSDTELASFLNGLIIEKRGPSDSPQRPAEVELTNNMIFNKVKIAAALQADDVIAILELADLSLGKYELSAFFRKATHKHYKACSDDVLSTFLKGLKLHKGK